MKYCRVFALFTLLVLTGTAHGQTAPNSRFDDYAPAFRRLPVGGAELWFTSAVSSQSGRNRQMMVAECTPDGFSEPVPVASDKINFRDPAHAGPNDVVLNGVPTFTCDGTFGVFVSNRLVDGRDEGNDLYEMWQSPDGSWDVRRITEIDSSCWDDTPSLSADGQILYFSSDRLNPGTRHTALFYARRLGIHEWSQPRPIPILDSESGNHEAPYAGPNGYFYYSREVGEHYEIWRAPMGRDGLPSASGSPVAMPNVNVAGSDATHPTFSPGGNWLLFSSNRADSGRTRDEDIYWVCMNPDPLKILVNSQEQERVREPASGLVYDKQRSFQTAVHFAGDAGNKTAETNADGNCEIALARGTNPATDVSPYRLTIRADAPNDHFVAPPAQVRYTLDTRDTMLRVIVLAWDTTSINDSIYRQSFPIADVRFFIEGYWGPTTFAYRHWLERAKPLASCPSFFADSDCLALGADGDPCESNNLYRYEYDTIPTSSTIKNGKRKTVMHTLEYRALRADVSPCFNYFEFDTGGTRYAHEVDAALDSLVSNMRLALQNPRVRMAADSNQMIQIKVTGFTDPKPISHECDYSDETVHFSNEIVHLVDDAGNPNVAVENRFVSGEPMCRGDDGNPLLSALRAFWAATLLDSLWYAKIPDYANLRDRHLLQITAQGKSVRQVKQGKFLSFAQRRSISVDITVSGAGMHVNGTKAPPGEVVDVTNQCRNSASARISQSE